MKVVSIEGFLPTGSSQEGFFAMHISFLVSRFGVCLRLVCFGRRRYKKPDNDRFLRCRRIHNTMTAYLFYVRRKERE